MASALVISPEPPYPVRGGGAIRTASLIEYLRRRYDPVDVVVFGEPGKDMPEGATALIRLARHSRSAPARAARNLRRWITGTPPLIDRFSGYGGQLEAACRGRHYDVAVLEHMWTAGYLELVRGFAGRVILDLHNIESTLHGRYARGLLAPVHRRWAEAAGRAESELLPLFDAVLAPSEADASAVSRTGARAVLYPNALPEAAAPLSRDPGWSIVFSGNLEYPPNVEAVRWFAARVWPDLRRRFPQLLWRIVGSNHSRVTRIAARLSGVDVTGPVEDAVAEIARSSVAVVPLFAGSGTRVKILEAWAACVPVVSTRLGAEGLSACDGEHLVLRDDAVSFASAVADLLEHPGERARIGEGGRRLLDERYTWPAAWRCLEAAGI